MRFITKKRIILCLGLAVLITFSFLFDTQIVKIIESTRNIIFDYFFLMVDFSSSALIIFLFLTTLFLYRKPKRRWVLPIALSVLLSSGLSFILKILIKRPRPFSGTAVKPLMVAFYFMKDNFNTWNFSFPSFQAMLVFSVLPIISKEFRKFKYAWLVFASLVCFSRVYFAVHYFSDVLIGAIIGYLIGYIIVLIEEKYEPGKKLFEKIG